MIWQTVLYGKVTVLRLISGLALLVFGMLAAKTLSTSARRFFRERLERETLEIVIRLLYYTVIVLVCLTALPMLGVQLSGVLVAGGVLGIAIGFASQNIVGNLISGIFLFLERPVKIGNAVSIDGTSGIVEDIEIMSTTLRGFDGLFIRMPNQKVFTANITNFVANVARRVDYDIGIRYTDNAEQAITLIKNIIEAHPFALKNPAPQVFVDKLDENAVLLAIRFWAPTTEWFGVKSTLLLTLKQTLEQAGMEIPASQRMMWVSNKQPPAPQPAETTNRPVANPSAKRRRRTTSKQQRRGKRNESIRNP